MMNVTELIQKNAKKFGEKTAVSFGHRSYTFQEFDQKINQLCHQFQKLGVKPQDKVLFFVRPNLDFAAITFALFRLGATTVFIDPGMKKEYFLQAIEEVNPNVLVGIAKVQALRILKPAPFKSVRLFIQTGFIPGFGKPLYYGINKQPKDFDIFKPSKEDLAAILYTSGGTGKPKGVEYTHEIFVNQTKMLRDTFHLSSKDVDIPGFPLFSFFSLAIGMQSHVPQIDVSKPSEVNPKQLWDDIQLSQATFLAGSPAIWDRLADYCLQNNLKLKSVKHVVMFGAAVEVKLHEKFSQILPQGTTYTPYGATECLPVSCFSGDEILRYYKKDFLSGRGICVGAPLAGVQVKIIPISHDIYDEVPKELEQGQIGEILVHSKNVTKSYHQAPEATKLAKIQDGQRIWHRMGDVGFRDEKGQIWFCGRLKHIVEDSGVKFYPAQIEPIFNTHSKVKRSALINYEGKATVVIQRNDHLETIEPMLLMDLKNLAQIHEVTKKISHFVAIKKLPVDVRHNIKIDRLSLGQELSS